MSQTSPEEITDFNAAGVTPVEAGFEPMPRIDGHLLICSGQFVILPKIVGCVRWTSQTLRPGLQFYFEGGTVIPIHFDSHHEAEHAEKLVMEYFNPTGAESRTWK